MWKGKKDFAAGGDSEVEGEWVLVIPSCIFFMFGKGKA